MDDFFKYPRRRIGFMALITALEFLALWLHFETRGQGRPSVGFFFYLITPLTFLSAYCFVSKPSPPKDSHKITHQPLSHESRRRYQ